jgi:hypothetical protein
MQRQLKQNTLLALTDAERSVYKNMVDDYAKFFANKQGEFKGERRTYQAKEGQSHDPSKEGFIDVTTTVDEKLQWFIEQAGSFYKHLFTQERTNAMSGKTVELVVEGKSFGLLTSLELLRLKNLLEAKDLGQLNQMVQNIPVRSDKEQWKVSTDPTFGERRIFETAVVPSVVRTTDKESYILQDPNLNATNSSNYRPVVAERTTMRELGDSTYQKFSGEITHIERANMLKRHTALLNAVIVALKEVNDTEVIESPLEGSDILGYIFYGA